MDGANMNAQTRAWQRDSRDRTVLQPTPTAAIDTHDEAIRSMVWSHNENWMVTRDDGGAIKCDFRSTASVKLI